MLHIVAVIKFLCYHTCEYKIKQAKRASLVIFILRYLIVISSLEQLKKDINPTSGHKSTDFPESTCFLKL